MRTGDKIGPYTLMRELGRGGFGIVWLGEKRTAFTTTQFALKMPKREDVNLEMIGNEAKLWVQASGHPNVLPIIEAEDFDGQIVIVSEFAPDGSLKDWLKRSGGKAPSVDAAIEMMQGILAGLEHLHNRKIVHRDLKPDNILLQGAMPRLADFGIARVSQTTGNTANVSGTLEYMSPEAFDGKRNPQTDIWACGIIFYEMLAGFNPFNPMGQAEVASLIGAIVTKELPPLRSDIPPLIRAVVEKALQKSPEKRFKSAREMRQSLTQNLNQSQTLVIEDFEPMRVDYGTNPLPNGAPTAAFSTNAFSAESLQFPAQFSADFDAAKVTNQNYQTHKDFQKPHTQTDIAPKLSPKTKPTDKKPPVNNAKSVSKSPSPVSWAAFGVIGLTLVGASYFVFNNFGATPTNITANVATTPTNTASATMPEIKATNISKTNLPKQMSLNLLAGEKIEFAAIPPGSFEMGSPETESERDADESPQHTVNIKYEFYIGKHEITQGQWESVMGAQPSKFRDCGDNCPVENVSWSEVQEFIKKLNARNDSYQYRLPSAAEWEYAARGGTKTANSFGDKLSAEQANFNGNNPFGNTLKGVYLKKPTAVGSYQQNAFGLYDMHGNVWEWVTDIFQDSYNNVASDGSANETLGDESIRVVRGGSWEDNGHILRSANRNWMAQTAKANNVGFRLVAQPK